MDQRDRIEAIVRKMAPQVRVSEPALPLQPRAVIRAQPTISIAAAEIRGWPPTSGTPGGLWGGDLAPPQAVVGKIDVPPAPPVGIGMLLQLPAKVSEIHLRPRPQVHSIRCADGRFAARLFDGPFPPWPCTQGNTAGGLWHARVFAATSLMARLPHVRRPVPPEQLSAREAAAFLREAEVSQGLAHETCRLVAVFRNVPTELVASMTLDAESGSLVFSLVPCDRRSRTRVYDLAYVMELENGEPHVIAHRTRYRTVFLS